MEGRPFTLAGAALRALPSGALFWAEAGLLCVSDLHFGKAQRAARAGGAEDHDRERQHRHQGDDAHEKPYRHVFRLSPHLWRAAFAASASVAGRMSRIRSGIKRASHPAAAGRA